LRVPWVPTPPPHGAKTERILLREDLSFSPPRGICRLTSQAPPSRKPRFLPPTAAYCRCPPNRQVPPTLPLLSLPPLSDPLPFPPPSPFFPPLPPPLLSILFPCSRLSRVAFRWLSFLFGVYPLVAPRRVGRRSSSGWEQQSDAGKVAHFKKLGHQPKPGLTKHDNGLEGTPDSFFLSRLCRNMTASERVRDKLLCLKKISHPGFRRP